MSGTTVGDRFWHPALFYSGRDDYLSGTVPFVQDGLAAGEPVAVAVPGDHLRLLREALGEQGAAVQFLDMTEAGRNPGRIIPRVLRAFADAHPTGRVRIIGEPIWAGRTATEYPACVQHEALINAAFEGRAVSILCPYDTSRLDSGVLADAHATHPTVIESGQERASGAYAPERVVSRYNQPLPPAPLGAAEFPFDATALPAARRFATEQAALLGLGKDRTADLELAVAELTTNSVVHGGGRGTLRLWVEGRQLVCEVNDAGVHTDPLAGRIPPPSARPGGRGLLLVNILSDLVRLHTGPAGTTTRIYLGTETYGHDAHRASGS
ncbi:anti-sigma factor RsbA family regulatory protein [Streptomyces sp. NPDC001848]|uniref:anti-sigma factor RsbA family regulatory protein n=1 Tax=Streptomyces sp. NPDC001848 TaxID=3364618 RepID=UPI0036B684CF